MIVEEKVIGILKKCVDMEFDLIENWKNKHFFSNEMNFAPRSLAIFYIEIEKVFKVKFPDEEINNNRFATFNGILKLLQDQL